MDSGDFFDRLPDALILLTFNFIADVKTLIRCRSVSHRFNSLVPLTDSLSLKVDSVISPESDHAGDFSLSVLFKAVVKSFCDLISPAPVQTAPANSPAQILRRFDRIQCLEIEFPAGDHLRLEKGACVKWKAEFGDALRSCVILQFRAIRDSGQQVAGAGVDVEFIGWLKEKVFWTISTLITASARHFAMREVVEEHREMKRLVLRDRDGEGAVEMEERGLEAWRKVADSGARDTPEECECSRTRTRVPGATVKMMNQARLELGGGVWMEDATMVVVRPTEDGGAQIAEADVDKVEADVARRAFDGLYREAVEALLKNGRRYQLEMNSF